MPPFSQFYFLSMARCIEYILPCTWGLGLFLSHIFFLDFKNTVDHVILLLIYGSRVLFRWMLVKTTWWDMQPAVCGQLPCLLGEGAN